MAVGDLSMNGGAAPATGDLLIVLSVPGSLSVGATMYTPTGTATFTGPATAATVDSPSADATLASPAFGAALTATTTVATVERPDGGASLERDSTDAAMSAPTVAATLTDSATVATVGKLPTGTTLDSPLYFYICLSGVPSNSAYSGYEVRVGPAWANIYRVDAGTETTLAEEWRDSANHWVGARVLGGVVSVWDSADGTTWTQAAEVSDPTYSSGGFVGFLYNDPNILDDFGGGLASPLSVRDGGAWEAVEPQVLASSVWTPRPITVA